MLLSLSGCCNFASLHVTVPRTPSTRQTDTLPTLSRPSISSPHPLTSPHVLLHLHVELPFQASHTAPMPRLVTLISTSPLLSLSPDSCLATLPYTSSSIHYGAQPVAVPIFLCLPLTCCTISPSMTRCLLPYATLFMPKSCCL